MKTISSTQILKLNGMSKADFEDDNAMFAHVEDLVRQNCEDFQSEYYKKDHPTNPLLHRWRWYESLGKKKSWTQTHAKSLDGQANLNSKKKLRCTSLYGGVRRKVYGGKSRGTS